MRPLGAFFRGVVLLLVAAAPMGCAVKVPTQPWVDAPTALSVMARRADSVRTFSSPCVITIKRADGYMISLDGAVAARIPGWLRVRAWKFGNAVMDVTVTPEGVWALRENGGSGGAPPAPGVDRLAAAWMLFAGRFFEDPGARVIDNGGARFVVERSLGEDGATVACEIDRPTLTARSYAIRASDGTPVLTLTLERYRLIGQTPWPKRLVAEIAPPAPGAKRPPDRPVRVTITFDDAEINPELPPGAFVPPRRAVREPARGVADLSGSSP